MTTPDKAYKAAVPAGITLAVLLIVTLVLSAWAGAGCL